MRIRPGIQELASAMRGITALLIGFGLAACGGESEAQSEAKVAEMVRQLTPAVERAIGLPFKAQPVVNLRSQEQVRAYLEAKLDADLPPELLDGMVAAYRLFGLLPDTLDVRRLFLSLYTEQVIGYYDPDSVALYVVQTADQGYLRMVLAHEMVHALQGQYLQLDTLIAPGRANDARMAAQAVLEGQATLASLRILMPDRDFNAIPDFWATYRESLKQQHAQMPVFNSAPLLIREGIVFPYLEGANFVRWFMAVHPDTLPYGDRLPLSTEQVLHPDRYHIGDRPVVLRLFGGPTPLHTDVLGEFETRILFAERLGSEATARAAARGWGGDRYAVYTSGDERALVWWTVWDDERATDRMVTLLQRVWGQGDAPGRAVTVEPVVLDGRQAVRVIDVPSGWVWEDGLPTVKLEAGAIP